MRRLHTRAMVSITVGSFSKYMSRPVHTYWSVSKCEERAEQSRWIDE